MPSPRCSWSFFSEVRRTTVVISRDRHAALKGSVAIALSRVAGMRPQIIAPPWPLPRFQRTSGRKMSSAKRSGQVSGTAMSCKRRELSSGLIYKWRKQARDGCIF
jgi:hypothetical protein